MLRRAALLFVLFVFGCALALGLAFAGSTETIAKGVTIAGVDVGGLTPPAAERLLEQRAAALERAPLVVRAGGRSFRVSARQLGVEPNWAAAAAAAQRQGGGFAPIRGFRRLYLRFFGSGDVTPAARAYEAAIDYRLGQIARAVDDPHRDAALRLRGLRPVVVPERTGSVLDRKAAEQLIVGALSSFERAPLALPVRTDRPKVTREDLEPVAAQVRTALSQPVRLVLGTEFYRVPPRRLAQIFSLPANGSRLLKIAGPRADAYFGRLQKFIDRAPRDAQFAIVAGGVHIVPSADGRVLDVPASAKNLLAAALSPNNRVAKLVVATKRPERTTAEAQAMGITGVVGSYQTIYGGIANRIHNVQLVARLIDNALIPPGKEFSFNATTGARTPEKGFLEAPVIINGELQTALGGGVCQVSTTVFNAAYEAGLPITARTNHALYISHYPQGRDATVNYPDVDLEFVNDTRRWLLLRTFVTASSLTVNLYGTPTNRRVESETAPLVTRGAIPVTKIKDPTLEKGKSVVQEAGAPPRSTSVRRRVYDTEGTLLYDNTWYSSYRGEAQVIRVGTKPKPRLEPKPVEPSGPPIIAAPSPLGRPLP